MLPISLLPPAVADRLEAITASLFPPLVRAARSVGASPASGSTRRAFAEARPARAARPGTAPRCLR